ncbi:unnamed protein product [Ilex paraguariensis]|uniref:FAS1 domain-containing protein n=1 Tax=Ilex paraguariensis TaxID=185542 RepID=A0ABC8T559_9AQUA
MATSLQLLTVFTFIFISTTITTTATTTTAPTPSQDLFYPPSFLPAVFSSLGFQELSTATNLSLITTATPTTIFAPTDTALFTCRSCSLPVLLQEHSVPGLYPLHALLSLAFGTKIETLAPNRCLTVTSTSTTSYAIKKAFINGAEIFHPDLFNNGHIIIHGIEGFVSHLSPLSCNVERMTSLSFPQQSATPDFSIMRSMLKDAMLRLRISGYSVVSLALRAKYQELVKLRSMTVFALDDTAMFAGGHSYLPNFRFHIVPNRLLRAADLVSLPTETILPTVESGENLLVTTGGSGDPLAPMRINYVKIQSLDLLYNNRIVVHGLSSPFPHLHHPSSDNGFGQTERTESDAGEGVSEIVAPPPRIEESTMEIEDQHALGGTPPNLTENQMIASISSQKSKPKKLRLPSIESRIDESNRIKFF